MFLQKISKFFKDLTLWRGVAAAVIGGIILAALGFLWWHFKLKPEFSAVPSSVVIQTGPNSVSQTAVGDDVHQVLNIDKSRSPSGGVYIERVESGAIVNINVINYVDGLPQAENAEVREIFAKGREYYVRGEFEVAVEEFRRCLNLERDSEKRGALNLQIGNCYYEQQLYLKAAEFYAAGLRESRKAKDLQGEASNLVGIANTYMLRPASSGKVRGDNIRKAVEHYSKALKVFNRDEYPVDYAGTQNNLGNAYTYLPSATSEERAENVRKAIDCYKAALEIFKKGEYPVDYAMTQNNIGIAYMYLPSATSEERARNVRAAIECYRAALKIRKKDEYPQDYCQTAANLGLVLASIDNPDACYWLREAYALREYLEDQGKRLEEVIRQVCKKEPK